MNAQSIEFDKIKLFSKPATIGLFIQLTVTTQIVIGRPASQAHQPQAIKSANNFMAWEGWTFFLKSFLVVAWKSYLHWSLFVGNYIVL
ncbi:hypothetical protein BCS42_08460 [Crenothrix sp. D3]|nr:hypothetical protein BCS42_08460 [Crenothrix sp. D3]